MSKWGTFLSILKQVGPVILAANPATAILSPIIVHAIGEAERIKGTGAQKKTHAMALLTDAVGVANGAGIAGFESPSLVLDTVSSGIDTVVGAVHVIEGTKTAQ